MSSISSIGLFFCQIVISIFLFYNPIWKIDDLYLSFLSVKVSTERDEPMLTFYTAKNDIVFKMIMTQHKNILKRIIESILEEEIEEITILNSELTTINVKSKKRVVDIYIQIKSLYINLEMNANPKGYTNYRNGGYLFNIYNERIDRGENYVTLMKKDFIGINLSYQNGKHIKEEYALQTKEGYKYLNNFKIIEINLEKLKKEWYTLDKKEQEKYKYLYMLDLDEYSLKRFVGEDKVMKEYEEAIKKINQNEKIRLHISEEKDAEMIYNSDIVLAKEEGQKEGAKQVAKKLLSLGINTIEQIAEATELSLEEVKQLKNAFDIK